MPLYDYTCRNCGDFEAWRTMAQVTTPMSCPDCDEQCTRLFIAPNISLNSGLTSRIQPSLEPRLVQRRSSAAPPPKNQSPRGGRPWMIGHAPERL